MNKTTKYQKAVQDIKERVFEAQHRALTKVNSELVAMYWDIGRIIVERQQKHKWGDSVVENIAQDLRVEFKGKGDFSRRNVFRMRSFYLAYRNSINVPQLVAQIGWGHHELIMRKESDSLAREYYIKASISNRWSRRILEERINNNEYANWALSQTNFSKTLDKSTEIKARNLIQDQVDLSCLNIDEDHQETELEDKIVTNIVDFLSQMGGDFAFIGRQYEVELKENIYKIDLLFFHRVLRCLIAIKLKISDFKPEYVGKMSAYLASLDKYEKKEYEHPSIGIIICRSKKREEVELSLQYITKPIGVSSYKTYTNREQLPHNIQKHMPSAYDIHRRLANF